MNATERRVRFREILSGDRVVYPAIVFDPLSAWIAQDVGYEVGFMAGPAVSASVLAAPNHYVSVLTATELAQQVQRVCRACDIPMIVVAENGYGNALNVMRTVEDLESAGASAITLDDPVLPFRFGDSRSQYGYETWEKPWEIAPLEESVGKLRAALKARQDPSFVVVARTRALGLPSDKAIDDVVHRIKAYEAAGADAILVGDIHSRAELEAVGRATQLPMLMNSASSMRLAAEGLTDDAAVLANGVRVRMSPEYHLWNSAYAMYETLKAMRGIRDGRIPANVARVPDELRHRFVKHSQYVEWAKEFMS